jgi:tRNA (guanine-N7-)-methyltransferase
MHPFWNAIFRNHHPVEIEIGSGTGTFLLAAAQASPETNFLGIEHSRSRAQRLEESVSQQQLRNVVVLNADATCVVERLVPPHSISAYHVYFPDPWWKRRHFRRRLFTPRFVAHLVRTLEPQGRLFVATDVPMVIDLIRETVATQPVLRAVLDQRPPRRAMTAFERKGLRRGAEIHEAVFVKQG